MSGSRLGVAVLAFAILAGCKVVSDPPKAVAQQDVDFLRGCWVSKAGTDGPVTGFLRLLPDRADGQSYQGYAQTIEGGDITGAVHLSFLRDGSSMTMRSVRGGVEEESGVSQRFEALPAAVAGRLPKVARRASYAVRSGNAQWIVAEGDDETLRIRRLGTAGQDAGDLFNGERDGCD